MEKHETDFAPEVSSRAHCRHRNMTDPDENLPYRIESEGDRFKVVDWEGNVLITSSTAANADQYAALLNQSYRRGYKAGFRNAKRPG
jgi:hypothetical protein